MAQLTRIYVSDDDANPVQDAVVTVHNRTTGGTQYQLTNGSGLAQFTLDEDDYVMSVNKVDLVAPAPVVIQVTVPPAATSAEYIPPAAAAPGLVGAGSKNIELAIDAGSMTVVDVTGGDDVSVDEFEIGAHIDAAIGAGVAFPILGRVRIKSPTTGATSRVRVRKDGALAQDATAAVFGQPASAGLIDILGQDQPTDWNDFDVVLGAANDFAATNPKHCKLWGRWWRTELQQPLVGAQVWVELLPSVLPTAVDVGTDVGDSFYAETDADGYLSFELMRGARARLYFQWLDRYVEISVPNAATARLDRLVSPYVTALSITAPAAPVGMTVGGTNQVTVQATYSDGSVKVHTDLALSSSNAAVFTVSGTIITAVGVGTAGLTATCTNSKGDTITSAALTIQVT